MNAIKTSVQGFGGDALDAGGGGLTARAGYPVALGFAAFAVLFGVYLGALTALSGWAFTREQLATYWYFILPLAAGFGVQVGLYTRLRQALGRAGPGRAVVAASGTTSTAAMVSCCAHYLVNILPVLGASGLVALAAQYQVEFFWVGLAANGAGVAFIATKLFGATREHAHCAPAPAAKRGMVSAKDPVCGMTVDPNSAAGSATCDGNTYWFCSANCLAQFNADPQRYASSGKRE